MKKNGDLDLDLIVASYFRNIIMKLPELQLTNQNKRHYYFRINSVNQLFAILTSVAPNWQRHSVKESCLRWLNTVFARVLSSVIQRMHKVAWNKHEVYSDHFICSMSALSVLFVTSHTKTLTSHSSGLAYRSNGSRYPFQKIHQPFEQREPSIQENSSAVRTA